MRIRMDAADGPTRPYRDPSFTDPYLTSPVPQDVATQPSGYELLPPPALKVDLKEDTTTEEEYIQEPGLIEHYEDENIMRHIVMDKENVEEKT